MNTHSIVIRHLGLQDYELVWEEMKTFNGQRQADTSDEIWFTEHPPVFTQGLNGKPEHLIDTGQIPLIPVDRGGQVTYHGPGQLIAYCLIDLQRRHWGVRKLVSALEQAIVDYLATHGIQAQADPKAPGVYVNQAKIAALGLRVKKGCSYHGLSLNVDMDLRPFEGINPCGYEGLKVVQLSDFIEPISLAQVEKELEQHLLANLG